MAKKQKIFSGGLPLTPEQAQYSLRIFEAEQAIKSAKKAHKALLDQCEHAITYSYQEYEWSKGHIHKEGSTGCDICGTHFGHYCPDSPDHACHYYTEDGKVNLYNGQVVDMIAQNPEHNSDYETDDVCLFCGAPEERK